MNLATEFGSIDIYLFDQLLRGRIRPGMKVFDAGCGEGRNLTYLFRAGYDVIANDRDEAALRSVRQRAATLAPGLPATNFRVEPVEATSFPAASADVAISSAVLHFAADAAAFDAMLDAMWRVLSPGGVLFCRLASSSGIETQVQRLHGHWFRLPDGSDRYLVDEDRLMEATARLGGRLLDPLKTTLVQRQRSMTTWVVAKP